jgi:hypothetical protein
MLSVIRAGAAGRRQARLAGRCAAAASGFCSGKGLRGIMSVPPLLDLASWSPALTVDSRSSVASDESSPRMSAISSEPGTPMNQTAGGDTAFQRQRQLSFEGDDVSSPSEDEDADDEAAVDMIAPRGAQLQIHLFPTFATLQDSGAWKVNVHGWYVMTRRREVDTWLLLTARSLAVPQGV